MAIIKPKKPRKVSRAAKMRKYFTDNPTATASEASKKFNTSYQVAYLIKRGMAKSKETTPQESEVKVTSKPVKKPKLKVIPTPKPRSGFTYRWVNTDALSEDDKDALAAQLSTPQHDPVNHPAHYKVGGIETIDFIEAKSLSYHLGNVVKYVTRADHKGNRRQDLEKAKWYLDRAISQL